MLGKSEILGQTELMGASLMGLDPLNFPYYVLKGPEEFQGRAIQALEGWRGGLWKQASKTSSCSTDWTIFLRNMKKTTVLYVLREIKYRGLLA